MSAERPDFRTVPDKVYRELHENPDARIKFDELEAGMLVEVYGTGPESRRQDIAINFTSQIEFIDLSKKASLGRIGIKLQVISGERLQLLPPEYHYPAFVSPEYPGVNSPLIWFTHREKPIHFYRHGNITSGFFASWADNDASQFLESSTSLNKNSPL